MPCKPSGVEHSSIMPVPRENVANAEIAEGLLLASLEVTVHSPVRLRVIREAAIALIGDVLHRDSDIAIAARPAFASIVLVATFVLTAIFVTAPALTF